MSTKASITADQLQKDLTDRINQAGMTAKSVTCKDDLVGEVGKTAHCDVSFSDTNNVEAVFTATKVEGTTVSFEITPAMTKEQVEGRRRLGVRAVGDVCVRAGRQGGRNDEVRNRHRRQARQADRRGPDGRAGQTGHGAFGLCAAAQERVADVLMQRLGADGQPVETVDCVDDMVSKVGSTVECVAVTAMTRPDTS